MYGDLSRAARMLSFSDHRSFPTSEDRFQRCTHCGKELVVLPNDRRGGACFDCFSLLGEPTTECAVCGTELSPPHRVGGCPACGHVVDR